MDSNTKWKSKSEEDEKWTTAEAIHGKELEILKSDFERWSGAVERDGRYGIVVESFPT